MPNKRNQTNTPGSQGTRTERQQRVELLRPGPGLLERAQQAEKAIDGTRITPGSAPLMLTVAEQERKVANPRTPTRLRTLLSEPFNQVSVVTEYLGLTGVGGLVVERFKQSFKLPVHLMINVTVEAPRFVLEGAESYRVPVQDDKKENISAYFDEVTAKMEEVHVKGKGAIVVHCMVGVSRSASFVLAYLMRYHLMSLELAFRYVKQRRSVINPNLGFLEQLAQFELQCRDGDKKQCSPWVEHTMNSITKRLPQFIVQDYIEEYDHEFELA